MIALSYILLGCLALTTAVLLLYLVLVVGRFPKPNTVEKINLKPVSVVICARNEIDNLKKNLPSILTQEFHEYEVVVADDASWDGTGSFLAEMSLQHENLSIVTITEEQKRTAGKKMALTLAFKKARYDTFLLTDADCQPKSQNWISAMANVGVKDIMLGYGGYEKRTGLLNLLIRYDTWTIACQYLSTAIMGRAYMGVGRNLLYTRSHYIDSGGFKKHYHFPSGDDDLFVNQTGTRKNVGVVVDAAGHTISSPASDWADWWKQKRRHISVTKAYTSWSKMHLWVYHSSQILFYLSIITCLATGKGLLHAGIAFGIKTTIHMLISIRPAHVLEEKEMVVLLPLLEPVLLAINLLVGLWSKISKPQSWK